MDCALWLNRRKIYSADEIPENPDIAALRGYYLGGSLEKWLREHNGAAYADRLAELDGGGDINKALAEIFGGSGAPMIEMRGGLSENYAENYITGSGSAPFRRRGSFGSYRLGSYRWGSMSGWQWEWEWRFGRGSSGSYRPGSYRWGSMSRWQWEWEWRFGRGSFGSYRLGSYRFGSFSEWEWEWYFGRGSYGARLGSYRSGSMSEWQWEWAWRLMRGSFGSYRLGSFRFGSFPMGSFGSFGRLPLGDIYSVFPESLDEYDRIMFMNLAYCPLNRFGYGIHNI